MIVSVVEYKVTIYTVTDDGLELFREHTKKDPVADEDLEGVLLSYLVSCGLEKDVVYLCEIEVTKKTSTGRVFTVSSSCLIRTGEETFYWESVCDDSSVEVIVEWDFDITQFIDSDQSDIDWFYRLDGGEWIALPESAHARSDSLDHITLTLNLVELGRLSIWGNASNADYLDVIEEIDLKGN